MKIRFLLALAGLAISSAVPAERPFPQRLREYIAPGLTGQRQL